MQFNPPVPLNTSGRRIRAVLIVALLIGNVFPNIAGVSIAAIATILTVPVIVYELLRWVPKFHKVLLFVIPLFGIVAAHALLIAPTTDYGDEKLWKWVTTTLISALAAVLIRDRAALYTLARVWVGASIIIAVFAVLGFDGGRTDVFDANPIWAGRAITISILMLVWLAWERQIRVWTMVACLVIVGGGLLTTGARGPILALILGAIVLAALSDRHRVAKIVGIAVGGAVAYWAVASSSFFATSRLNTLLMEGDSGTARELFWTITPPVIAANPGGVGFGNWAVATGAPRQFLWPHNIFLEVFSEFGILVGTVFTLLLVFVLIRLAVQCRFEQTTLLVLALLVAETVSVSVSGDLNARTFFFLLTLGYLITARSVLDAPAAVRRHKRARGTPGQGAVQMNSAGELR